MENGKIKKKISGKKKIILTIAVSVAVIALLAGGVKFYQIVQQSKINVPASITDDVPPWMNTEETNVEETGD